MIKITNLNKYFYRRKPNEIHVINDVSLEFPQTGLVTIIGESGSGKTTLMNVIGGLDDFASGSIEVDDVTISKYSSRKIDKLRNEKIGYIFQNYLLLQQRTVYDNLELLLNMYNLSEEEKNERIEYVLKAVGMLKYKKKNVSQLSGGQQQRVAIARALIKSPSLILADEPTGNLDEKNTLQIMNIIKKISKKILVILVSHEENIASSYSDYIIKFSDGKVVDNLDHSNLNTYSYEDDQNIYLKEYEQTEVKNDLVNISYYDNDKKPIELKIIQRNGKFYIYSNEEIVLINDKSERKVIDDYKQDLDVEKEIEENDYELQPLEFKKTPSLSFKEQIHLAFQNLNKLRKRIIFLAFPLILISVLILFSIQSIETASIINYQEIVNVDSGVYTINIEKGEAEQSDSIQKAAFEAFYDEFLKDNPNIDPILNYHPIFGFTLPNFKQIEREKYNLSGFSMLPIDKISEDDLIYGKMPTKPNEIVVDRWVLENTIKSTVISNFMSVNSFIGKELTLKNSDFNYRITGIVAKESHAVYINKWAMFDLYPSSIKRDDLRLCSLSDVKKHLGDNFNVTLEENEALMSTVSGHPITLKEITIDSNSSLKYNIIDRVDLKGLPYQFVLPDEAYDKILKSIIANDADVFNVYCDNLAEIEQVEKYLEDKAEYYQSGELMVQGFDGSKVSAKLVTLSESIYYDTVNPYVEQAKKDVISRTLITITIVLISMVLVFFSMKSFSIKNIYDIGVYRAIGINKGSIVFVYALEIFIISLRTTFIGSTLCFLISNFLTSVPILNISLQISLPIYLFSTIGLILINVIVGIIPVMLYLRLTPSRILTKYDI